MNTLEETIVNYWDAQPCNIKHGTSPIGSLEFFNEQAQKRYRAEPHIKDFAKFELYRGKRVLEIGCGIGADAAEFAKNGAEYVGIDISTESVALAKRRFEVQQLSGSFHVHNGIDDLSKFGKFDLVYSFGVIHHYPNENVIVNNIHNVLNNGGEFKMMVYAKDSWKYAMIQKGLDQYEAQANCPYAKCYTNEDIRVLFGDKFDINVIKQAHCFMYNVEKYKKGTFELEPWFAAMPETMREAVKEYLGWHLLVTATKR
jgi:SAM-dependent methyltransferase